MALLRKVKVNLLNQETGTLTCQRTDMTGTWFFIAKEI